MMCNGGCFCIHFPSHYRSAPSKWRKYDLRGETDLLSMRHALPIILIGIQTMTDPGNLYTQH